MKIYEIGTGYTPIPAQISAATEIVVEELTRAMVKQNVSVEIIDIAADCRAETDLPLREVRVPKLFAGTDVQLGLMHKLKRVVYSVALAGELRRILKAAQGKIVLHFHNQYNLFFFLKLVPKKLRRRCVVAYTNHSGIWRLPWDTVEDTIRKRYFQEAECMKRADIVFVLNDETKRNVIEHLGVQEDRIAVIRNGVNADVYRPLPEQEKQAAKKKLGLECSKVILQVGSVNENKGQLRSAERMIPLLKKYSDLVFAYAGGIVEQEYYERIQTLAKEQGLERQIRYLGMIEPGKKLNEVYNIADAVLCASRYEGFSLVIVEALSAGVPVLMEASSPFSVGEGCVRYENDEFASVLENTVMIKDSEYQKLCACARDNALHAYSWDKVATAYLQKFT